MDLTPESVNAGIHILFGSVTLLAGVVALSARKGARWHVRGGFVFASTMIVVVGTTLFAMFHRFLPLAILLALAEVYLIPAALLAVGKGRQLARGWLWPFTVLAALLGLFAAAQFVRLNFVEGQLFIGPGVFACMFGFLVWQDWLYLRGEDHPNFRLRRHLTRMILAFAIAAMALARIGLDFGLSIQITTLGPLAIAAGFIVWQYRKYPVPRKSLAAGLE